MTVSYDNPVEDNGRYRFGTTATISCDETHQLYGFTRVDCGIFPYGMWEEPIEKFRCIPKNQS